LSDLRIFLLVFVQCGDVFQEIQARFEKEKKIEKRENLVMPFARGLKLQSKAGVKGTQATKTHFLFFFSSLKSFSRESVAWNGFLLRLFVNNCFLIVSSLSWVVSRRNRKISPSHFPLEPGK
jgi:hypothetical protein